jgi:hypothetical protein
MKSTPLFKGKVANEPAWRSGTCIRSVAGLACRRMTTGNEEALGEGGLASVGMEQGLVSG